MTSILKPPTLVHTETVRSMRYPDSSRMAPTTIGISFMVMLFTLLALFSLQSLHAAEVNSVHAAQRQEQVVVFYLDEQFRPVTKLERLGPLSEGIKAILAMYALQVGGGCEGRDEHGVRCVLTTSLELGAQCSERHLSLVRSWFKKDLPRMHGFSDQSIQRALKSGDLQSICYNAPHTATRQAIWKIIRIKKDNDLVFVDAVSHWTASSGGDGPSGQNRYQTEYRINPDTVTVVSHKKLPVRQKDRQSELFNGDNWQNYPEIKKSESLRTEVNAAEKAGNLKEESRKCVHGNLIETEGTLYKDRSGKVRKYIVEAIIKNSVGRAEYYYSPNGIPGFSYRLRGEYYGEKNEERIYFDSKGKHLYTDMVSRRNDYLDVELEDSVGNPTAHYANLCKSTRH